jgi:3'(2'), 5'-bisphosphate nucleotidase
MNFYEEGAEVTWKEDGSPLTSADSASHDFLVESIRSSTPEVPIISDESEDAAEGLIDHAKGFWLVDPLDGTKEFLRDQRRGGIYSLDGEPRCYGKPGLTRPS